MKVLEKQSKEVMTKPKVIEFLRVNLFDKVFVIRQQPLRDIGYLSTLISNEMLKNELLPLLHEFRIFKNFLFRYNYILGIEVISSQMDEETL